MTLTRGFFVAVLLLMGLLGGCADDGVTRQSCNIMCELYRNYCSRYLAGTTSSDACIQECLETYRIQHVDCMKRATTCLEAENCLVDPGHIPRYPY